MSEFPASLMFESTTLDPKHYINQIAKEEEDVKKDGKIEFKNQTPWCKVLSYSKHLNFFVKTSTWKSNKIFWFLQKSVFIKSDLFSFEYKVTYVVNIIKNSTLNSSQFFII